MVNRVRHLLTEGAESSINPAIREEESLGGKPMLGNKPKVKLVPRCNGIIPNETMP